MLSGIQAPSEGMTLRWAESNLVSRYSRAALELMRSEDSELCIGNLKNEKRSMKTRTKNTVPAKARYLDAANSKLLAQYATKMSNRVEINFASLSAWTRV